MTRYRTLISVFALMLLWALPAALHAQEAPTATPTPTPDPTPPPPERQYGYESQFRGKSLPEIDRLLSEQSLPTRREMGWQEGDPPDHSGHEGRGPDREFVTYTARTVSTCSVRYKRRDGSDGSCQRWGADRFEYQEHRIPDPEPTVTPTPVAVLVIRPDGRSLDCRAWGSVQGCAPALGSGRKHDPIGRARRTAGINPELGWDARRAAHYQPIWEAQQAYNAWFRQQARTAAGAAQEADRNAYNNYESTLPSNDGECNGQDHQDQSGARWILPGGSETSQRDDGRGNVAARRWVYFRMQDGQCVRDYRTEYAPPAFHGIDHYIQQEEERLRSRSSPADECTDMSETLPSGLTRTWRVCRR